MISCLERKGKLENFYLCLELLNQHTSHSTMRGCGFQLGALIQWWLGKKAIFSFSVPLSNPQRNPPPLFFNSINLCFTGSIPCSHLLISHLCFHPGSSNLTHPLISGSFQWSDPVKLFRLISAITFLQPNILIIILSNTYPFSCYYPFSLYFISLLTFTFHACKHRLRVCSPTNKSSVIFPYSHVFYLRSSLENLCVFFCCTLFPELWVTNV